MGDLVPAGRLEGGDGVFVAQNFESTRCWGAKDRRGAVGRVKGRSCQCSGTAACQHYARGI